MNISLAVTTRNRFDFLKQTFDDIIYDERISEIIILDDESDIEEFKKAKEYFSKYDKVKIRRQLNRRGMQQNKRDAIAYCSSNRVIIFDDDNIIKRDYLDALFNIGPLYDGVIYMPEMAAPNFNFKHYVGMSFNAKSAKKYMHDPMFRTLLNCCNYVIPRNSYLSVYEHDPLVKASDTVNFAYMWLKAGYSFYVVEGMKYIHNVHSQSGFLEDVNYNMANAMAVEEKIRLL